MLTIFLTFFRYRITKGNAEEDRTDTLDNVARNNALANAEAQEVAVIEADNVRNGGNLDIPCTLTTGGSTTTSATPVLSFVVVVVFPALTNFRHLAVDFVLITQVFRDVSDGFSTMEEPMLVVVSASTFNVPAANSIGIGTKTFRKHGSKDCCLVVNAISELAFVFALLAANIDLVDGVVAVL